MCRPLWGGAARCAPFANVLQIADQVRAFQTDGTDAGKQKLDMGAPGAESAGDGQQFQDLIAPALVQAADAHVVHMVDAQRRGDLAQPVRARARVFPGEAVENGDETFLDLPVGHFTHRHERILKARRHDLNVVGVLRFQSQTPPGAHLPIRSMRAPQAASLASICS